MDYLFNERIGLQTIIYGEDFARGLEATLEEIHRLGFTGVEIFQTVSKLGDPAEFERLLAKYDLTLLGLTGGSMQDRLAFCEQLTTKPKFLYLQPGDGDGVGKALGLGYHLAIHPHQYSPLDSYRAARKAALGFPKGKVSVLPDSAHLFLSAERLDEILDQDGDEIQFIHLKDWTPEFGTSMFSYARGFCELGAGIVLESPPFRDRLARWHRRNPERWIIVEQDSSHRSPRSSGAISLDWLRGNRKTRAELRFTRLDDFQYGPTQAVDLFQKDTAGAARPVLEAAIRSNLDSLRDVGRHFRTVLIGLAELVPLKYATIWEISPREDTAVLRATWQPLTAPKVEPKINTLNLQKALCGLAVRRQEIQWVADVATASIEGYRFTEEELRLAAGLKSMVSIPIPNRWNPNQPEIIINLFPERLSDVVEGAALVRKIKAALDILKPYLTITIERAWDQAREQIREELNWVAAGSETVKELVNGVLEPIRNHLDCRSVEIYLVEPTGLELTLKAPTTDPPRRLQRKQGPAGTVWDKRQAYNSGTLLVEHRMVAGSHLLTPIYRQGTPLGEVLGVIWCRDKKMTTNTVDFTVTDQLTLDAAQAALIPHLERMMAAEHRMVTMTRINHELKEPLTIFRGATTAILKEMKERGWKLKEDHMGRVRSHLELMEQIVAKSAFFRSDKGLIVKKRRTLLFEDIIDPAILDLAVYLEDRNFSVDSIIAERKTAVPALFVDQVRFQQVVFNILTNAIKYAHLEPARFAVKILAEKVDGGVNLIFRDKGIGIPPGMEEAIFLEGVRGPNATQYNAPGDGVGLFIVREILKAHGATIKAGKSADTEYQTDFVIFLPTALTIPDFSQTAAHHHPPTSN